MDASAGFFIVGVAKSVEHVQYLSKVSMLCDVKIVTKVISFTIVVKSLGLKCLGLFSTMDYHRIVINFPVVLHLLIVDLLFSWIAVRPGHTLI